MKNKFQLNVVGILALLCTLPVMAANDHSKTIAIVDNKGKLHWINKDAGTNLKINPIATKRSINLGKKLTLAPFPLEDVKGGAIGGNEKMGFVYYDGLKEEGHASALSIQRDPISKTCYLQNNEIVVRDWNRDLDIFEYPCAEPDKNGIYWNANYDFVNGAFNPAFDAFYAAQEANRMYQTWFRSPTWNKGNKANKIILLVHASDTYFNEGGRFPDDAEPRYVSLSDGDDKTYPWTTLDVVSHFISVGTALSHWGYAWGYGNSPSIAVSYSDAFAKAVEFNATGKVTWSIGAGLTKDKYYPLRSMENPPSDCSFGHNPGESCSIATYDDFKKHIYIESEYGAGLINKLMYLLSTSPNWNIEKSFRLFNRATYYFTNHDWYPGSNQPLDVYFSFYGTFCALKWSAEDYNYSRADLDVIDQALLKVGMDPKTCIERLHPPRSVV